ncbi:protein phosphatase 2C domain-containing protein [Polyangium mundeleinium]|uniref:Protein phosphatase 2C domain-containing protein n=1 Tax=Polyangium mundeleinium TaxID=2995306 RepID=A0ABT5EKZ0_9BACT|nr:protein phosphatase 2C domain-containing protein [Polyangium mundeleinium]MDC0741858.1 protein phosphatase 2C domain-containing protein [Polyangium mundeleinium]
MRVDERFEVAAGSVTGRSHVLAGKPNQDAFAFRSAECGIVGVVCDGCGSGAHNEIGAAIGARILASQVLREMEAGAAIGEEATFERVRERLLLALASAAQDMGIAHARGVAEFFLFTVLGVAISAERAVVFGAGDGIFAVGDEVVRLGPFPGNAPPYLGYGLSGAGPRVSIHRVLPASALTSVLVGTDGAADYDTLAGALIPGAHGERVPPLRAFWSEDRYFRNADAVRRSLALVNRDVTRPLWDERRLHKEPGLLEDDTTLLVVRRKKTSAPD